MQALSAEACAGDETGWAGDKKKMHPITKRTEKISLAALGERGKIIVPPGIENPE
jgi:hypothetical protein